MGRTNKFIQNQIKSDNPFSKSTKPDIGSITNPVKEDAFLDTGETTFVKTEDYKDYIQKDRGASSFAFKSDYDLARALGQSNWEQAGNATLRLLPNTALEIVNQTAGLLDLEDYANADNEVGNWLSTWATEQKAKVDESTPIYQEAPGEHLKAGDFAWWMENGTNLVQSATAFAAIGYATGGASLSVLSKAGQAAKWLRTLGKTAQLGDKGKKIVQGASTLANSFLLTHAEGYGVGVQVYDKAYKEKLEELQADPNLSPEEADLQAKQDAARKAENAINFNKLNILLNLSSAGLFLKAPKLTRQALKLPSITTALKHVGTEGIQEAAEESVNLAAEKTAESDDFSIDKIIDSVFTKEGAESALLGFIGGAMQTGLTNAGRELKIRKDPQGNRISENSLLRQRVVNQERAKQEWQNLSKADKLSSATDAYMTFNEQAKLYEEYNKARQEDDVKKVNKIGNQILYNQAYNAFNTGTTEQLLEVYKGISKLSEEEAEKRGLDLENYKKQSIEATTLIKTLENEYNNAQQYLNDEEVYNNRAELNSLRKETKELERVKNELQENLNNDLADLNLEQEELTKEEGEINKKITELQSYQELKALETVEENVNSRKQELISHYNYITSDKRQAEIRSKFNYQENNRNRDIQENESKKQKLAETQEKASTKERIKKETTQPPAPSINTEGENTKGFRFDAKLKPFQDGLNRILFNQEMHPSTIVQELESKKEQIEGINFGEGQESSKQNVLKQLDEKIEEFKVENKEVLQKAQNLDAKIANIAETLEREDNALSKAQKDKVKETTNTLLDVLDEMSDNGIDVSNFKEVGSYFRTVLGKDRFLRLYPKIQGIFNIVAKEGKTSSDSYEDLFLDEDEKSELIKDDKVISDSLVPAQILNMYEEELLAELDAINSEELKRQGFTKYTNEKLGIDVDKAKVEEGHNKIAHLDKKYSKVGKGVKTDRFNVLDFVLNKEDLDKKLNENASTPILDYREINKGSKIKFVAVDNAIYDDGTIVTRKKVKESSISEKKQFVSSKKRQEREGGEYKTISLDEIDLEKSFSDEANSFKGNEKVIVLEQLGLNSDGIPVGKVRIIRDIGADTYQVFFKVPKQEKSNTYLINKNGTITEESGINIAPIQVEYNGELLKGAYLHLPDWINANTVRGDVSEQKQKLIEIRQAVLNSPNGIETTITNRGNGFPLISSEGFINKTNETMNGVSLAVGKNGEFYTSSKKSISLQNYYAIEGVLYGLYPVNKGIQMAAPLKGQPLNERPEYIGSILEAVKLYLNNDYGDSRVIKIQNELGYSINTLDGLTEYLNDIIYVPLRPKNWDKFRTEVAQIEEKFPIIESTNYTINFSIGKNHGNTVSALDRGHYQKLDEAHRKVYLEKILGNLEKVLRHNVPINTNLNRLGKEFKLGLITESNVQIQSFDSYDEFIKDHSYTANYSYNLPNGNTIYTVQSTLEFDTSNLNEVKVAPAVKAEIEEENNVEQNTIKSDEVQFNLNDDLFGDDFAPRIISEEEAEEIRATNPDSLQIHGVPIAVQETLINHLYTEVIKRYSKDKNKNAYAYVGEFAKKLEVIKHAYIEAVKENPDKQRQLDVVNAIIDNYTIIMQLATEKMQQLNNLNLDGKTLKEITKDLEEDNIDIQDLAELKENEVLEYDTWQSDRVFKEDYRNKVSTDVKNLFTNIPEVNPDTLEPIKSIFNITKMVPLEVVINDITAITAYNNSQFENTSNPDIKSLIKLLEEQAINKPYLYNAIKELENADKQTQNKFVRNMSKHYTHHKLGLRFKKEDQTIVTFKDSDANHINNLIQNQWLNGLMLSDIVVEKDEKFSVDSTRINAIDKTRKELVAAIRKGDTDYFKITSLFEDLGLNFDTKLVKDIDAKGVPFANSRHRLLQVLGNSDGFVKLYVDRLKFLAGKDLGESHPFEDLSALKLFAKEIAKLYPNYYAHSFKDVEGATYFSYSQNKFIVDRFKELRTNTALHNQLKKQPFTSNSFMLDQMLKDDNIKYYNYYAIDGYTADNVGKKFAALSLAEQEEFKLNLFFSQNKYTSKRNKDKPYIINTFYPTTSDKSVIYGFGSVGFDFKRMVSGNNINSAAIDILYSRIVKPEVLRILDAQNNLEKYKYNGTKNGSTMFLLFPELNSMEELFLENTHTLKDITTDKQAEQVIKDFLKDTIDNLAKTRVDKWNNFKFIKEISETTIDSKTGEKREVTRKVLSYTESDALAEAYNYEINTLLANMGIFQLFTTDIANYWKSSHWKSVAETVGIEDATREDVLPYYQESDWIQEHLDTFDNMGKRLAADAAPGEDIPNSTNKTFNISYIADNIVASNFSKYFDSILEKSKSKDYLKINSTDAQELTTLEEHLNLMEDLGEITKQQKTSILNKEKNSNLTREDFKKIFNSALVLNPMKPRYVKNIWRNGVERRIYIKSSSFPLIKQLTKGLEMDKVRVAMEKSNIQRLVYESALKVGGLETAYSIFEKDGTIPNDVEFILNAGRIDDLPRDGIKIQQQIPYKEDKTTITNPTQTIALITSTVRKIKGFTPFSNTSITGEEVQTEIDNRYQELFKLKYDRLVKELEYDINSNTLNINKLRDILKKEGIQRNYPLYDLMAFNVKNGKFEVPLWATGVSSKIQSMLNSIVDNRIRKHKPRGASFVLGSNQGMKPKILEGKDAEEYLDTNTGIAFNQEWLKESKGKLRPMRIEKGEVQPAEVIAPFRLYDDKGNKLSLQDYITPDGILDTTNISDDILVMLGFRIPTQGLKSMSYIKIVGFLPENSGDLLLTPDEFVVQMGSDFDVDKLYSLMYHTTLKDKKVVRLKEGDRIKLLDNELLDLYLSILRNPSKAVQSQISAPLDFGMLNDLAAEIYPKIVAENDMRGLTESYQSFKYNNARIGKEAVGVFSNDMRLMANLADKGIYLSNSYGKPISFKIGGVTSTPLSYPYSKAGKLKANIIEAYQSLAVDNEKEQGLHKLNINQETFGVIRAMAMSGIEEDIISYFLNQPIVRRYVELKQSAKDGIANIQDFEIMDILKDEFPSYTDSQKKRKISYTTNITRQDLINQLDGEVDNESQRVVLDLFKFLSYKGGQLQKIQTSLNTFNAGVGKNIFYSIAKEKQIKELVELGEDFKNIFNLVGDYLNLSVKTPYASFSNSSKYFSEWNKAVNDGTEKEFVDNMLEEGFYPITKLTQKVGDKYIYRKNVQFIKPKTIAGLASIYATMFNNQIWNEYFPYNTSTLLNTVDALKSIRGLADTNLTNDTEISQNIFNSIKSYLTTKAINTYTNGDIQSERDRLFLNTDTNKSLAHIIYELKKSGKLNNLFINRLELDLRASFVPSTIKYKANVAETLYEREVYQSFNNMLLSTKELGTFNGIEYTVGKLAQDMITSQLLSGGIQGANQFLKYVPINYLNTIGFYNELSKNFSDSIEREIIIEQAIQHNPKLVFNPIIQSIEDTLNFNKDKTKFVGDFPNKYISFRDGKSLKGYRLYKQSEQNPQEFYQISSLGYRDFLEYSYDTLEAESVLPHNNPVVNLNKNREIPKVNETEKFYTIPEPLQEGVEVIQKPVNLNIEEKYNLASNSIGTILNEIANNSKNKANVLFAMAAIGNINSIQSTRLIINPNLKVDGSFNYNDNTIKLNPNNFVSPEEFEKVFLEEVIHAITKKDILENKRGEVLRLKGLLSQTEKAVKLYYKSKGEDWQEKFIKVQEKVNNLEALTEEEADLIYPLINLEEFVGRVFKSKRLQQIMNEVEADKGISLWEKFKNFIGQILSAIGIDIKKGNVLDYALTDILSLISTPAPTEAVKKELKKVNPIVRTVEFVEKKFELRDKNNNLLPIENAEKVAEIINRDIEGIEAKVVEKTLSLFDEQEIEEIRATQENLESNIDYIILNNLPKITPESAKRETRLKVGTNQDINPSWLSKNGVSIENASEYLYNNYLKNRGIEQTEVRDVIIDIISSGNKSTQLEEITGEKRLKELLSDRDTKYVHVTYKENNSPSITTTSNIHSFIENIQRRVQTLKDFIDKASAQKDYKKVEELKQQLETLESRKEIIGKINNITPLITQGKQDMEEIQQIFDRGVSVQDAIYIKEVTDYWTNLDKILFTEDDRYSDSMKEFKEIDVQARIYADKLHQVEEKYINEILTKYGKQTTVDEIFKYYQDINSIAGNTLDISRFDNPLLNNLLIQLKNANIETLDDFNKLLNSLDKREENLRNTLKSLGYENKNLFEVFRQKDDKGRNTNHLVKRYKLEFLLKRGSLIRSMSVPNNKAKYTNLINWSKENTKHLDLELLFPLQNKVDKQKQKEYIDSLKKELGETHFEEIYQDQKKKIDRYHKQLESFKDLLVKQHKLANAKEIKDNEFAYKAFAKWVSQHSPYSYYRHLKGGLKLVETGYTKFRSYSYVTMIPKDVKDYDSNFKIIESNKDLHDFYKYYEEIDSKLQDLLPEKERINLVYKGLPYLSNTANNAFREQGYKAGLAPIKDMIARGIRIKGEQDENINPINDRAYRNLDIVLTKDNHLELSTYKALKSVEYQEQHNGELPSKELLEEWTRDKVHELSQKQSFDLPAVLRMYALTTLTYSHKAKVEDYMRLIQNIFERQKETRRDGTGEVKIKENGRPDIREASNSFQNTKAALDYTADAFYGITKKNELVQNKKAYTTEEKKTLKEIEDKLLKLKVMYEAGNVEEAVYLAQVDELESIKSSLGGLKVWSRKGDGLLKYVQLKGMGWNFMSSIANIGFGFISNYVEAAGGLTYSRKSLDKAYLMTRHSLARNATFNRYTNSSAEKIRSIMDNWDVLKDASTELYDDPYGIKLSKKHRWLEPYNLTQRTEYLNQAPLMIALLLDKKLENGETYWDALNEKGEWNTEEYGEEPKEEIRKLRLKLDQIVKSNHGNYDPISSLRIKDRFIGRAVSQFRTWMFEGVANRFEKKKYDDLLEEYRKGRYRSVFEYVGEYGFQAPLDIIKGLIRSITFGKVFNNANFDHILENDKFDNIDAANMRKMMAEVTMLIGIGSTYVLLSSLAEGLDDDDDKFTKYVANNLINQGLRLKTDILFYLNPNEFKNLLRDLIPLTSLITDVGSWFQAVHKFATGEDEIKAGVYSGHSRLLRESTQMMPFGTQIYKNINYSIQTFDK